MQTYRLGAPLTPKRHAGIDVAAILAGPESDKHRAVAHAKHLGLGLALVEAMILFHLVKAPGKNQHIFTSDEFLLKPTRGKTNLKQMEVLVLCCFVC